MRYKTKFKDYVPEKELSGTWLNDKLYIPTTRFDIESMRNLIWGRIKKRYPKREKFWDEIYEVVEKDFEDNYDFEITVKIKEVRNE